MQSGYAVGTQIPGEDPCNGSRGPGRGSRLRAAAARRLNYASQPAPQQPRAPAPRPPAGSRLLIAALAGPRCRPCSWPRSLGADALAARTAGSRMGALKGERSGGGWRPARARRCLQPRPAVHAGAAAPSLQREDAPQRRRSACRARRAGLPLGSPAPRTARGCAELSAAESDAAGGARGVGPTPRSAAPHPLQSAGLLQGGRGLLSSRAAGLGFSTPGFVPHFLFSCERLTSSWSLMPLTASLKRVVGKGGVGWTPAGVFF